MGNESSQLAGLEIDEKATEVTEFWAHNSATLYNETITFLSVFTGESYINGSLWTTATPLEKMTKNLMLNRHPCILKYISSWQKGLKHYLAVENVKPLSHVLNTQTPLQICIGLYSILKAIMFLHEKAHSSHNNICSASIYVTKDGSWKLGGLEYLCRFDVLSPEYLTKTRMHRYEKAIHPNESTYANDKKFLRSGAIDKYAFSILVHELLNSRKNVISSKILTFKQQRNWNESYFYKLSSVERILFPDDTLCVEEFKEFCKNEIQNKNIMSLPKFEAILEHPFFTQDFIVIYSFLTELALKTETERQTFFTELATRLKAFPEEIVARQLGELLLSRLVLLDNTACKHLLPLILKPKEGLENDNPNIFSIETFKQNIVPKLLHIFCVRDAQIRLLLLNYFKSYVNHFTKEQLQNHILPELLIGIKDTNDHLVSVTLNTLADLVPILGAAIVIGGKRVKLFNDGRPNTIVAAPRISEKPRRSSLLTATTTTRNEQRRSSAIETSLPYTSQDLPERLSPDGGEDDLSVNDNPQSNVQVTEEDLDSWSDWDNEDNTTSNSNTNDDQQESSYNLDIAIETNVVTDITSLTINQKLESLPRKEIATDIDSLDIKHIQNVNTNENNEFDYFLDMEPVIEKTNKYFVAEDVAVKKVEEKSEYESSEKSKINLSMNITDDSQVIEDCWGDDLSWAVN